MKLGKYASNDEIEYRVNSKGFRGKEVWGNKVGDW